MRIVLTGGGTAGHINPALALAEILQDQGHEVFFAGTPLGVEARLAKEAELPYKAFEAAGFNRNHPTSIFKALYRTVISTSAAKKWLAEISPDVVVGFGGYVSMSVGRAAKKLTIPLVVHEQNSVMGMANKYLGKFAHKIALTYEVSGQAIEDKSKLVVTGNPIRKAIIETTRDKGRAYLGLPANARVLLVFGGSLGARHINSAIASLKMRLLSFDNLYIVHVTGPKEFETTKNALQLSSNEQRRWLLFDYQDHMGETYAAADMVVSRAGATSLAEISALKIPALLVPFPFATEDHQTTNAQAYVERGAAYMVSDDDLDFELFAEKLFTLIENEEVRQSMKEAASTFETQEAAKKLADVVVAQAAKPIFDGKSVS